MPERIQLRRTKGWRMPPNTVRVDRRTLYGNPFVVGRDGTQARCVELFRLLMAGKICLTHGDVRLQERCYRSVKAAMKRLRGKNLACWCAPGKPCHADVLLEVFNQSAERSTTWYCRCGAANVTERCSNCKLTAEESDEAERRYCCSVQQHEGEPK